MEAILVGVGIFILFMVCLISAILVGQALGVA